VLLLAGGCAQSDRVLFVTSSSLGINVDSKPAAASLAYDRTEGFIGPRYDNGGMPEVVAMIDSDGGLFEPEVRQIYATGAAATTAVGGNASGPTTLTGGRKMAFFGTSTTTGFKIGFGEAAPIPDSFLFGFRRKEVSLIPLATTGTGNAQSDVYASVLGSYDSGVAATGKPNDSKFRMKQFFATGQAAELLAKRGEVRSVFASVAADSLKEALSPEAYAKNIDLGEAAQREQTARVKRILDRVAPIEAVNEAELKALIKRTTPEISEGNQDSLIRAKTRGELNTVLELNLPLAKRLDAALEAQQP
jgi:hypothetical protein